MTLPLTNVKNQMGRASMDDENRLLSNEEEEEEEDDQEEALSLSDLPIHEELRPESEELEPQPAPPITQLPEDDFDFGSATTESEMCAADDVFFRGWILPLRHSVSSDSGLGLLRADSQRSLSRSGSMDNSYQSHKSVIIRSGSTRSQYSSSCSSSRSSSTRTNNSTIPKIPKPPNPFQHYYYTHRRPVPGSLNRASKYVQGQMMKSNNNNNNNMWSILRLGLVRTPTMEPLDIKFHGNNNRNPNQDQSQSQSQSLLMGSNQGKEKEKEVVGKDKKKHKFPYFGGGGCKCSAETVVVPSRIASEKGPKEKTKRDMSRRHRTYEWLKELSVADEDEEEEEEGRGRDRGNLGKVER